MVWPESQTLSGDAATDLTPWLSCLMSIVDLQSRLWSASGPLAVWFKYSECTSDCWGRYCEAWHSPVGAVASRLVASSTASDPCYSLDSFYCFRCHQIDSQKLSRSPPLMRWYLCSAKLATRGVAAEPIMAVCASLLSLKAALPWRPDWQACSRVLHSLW